MGNSCSIAVYCRNSEGEVVESKLFKDLLSLTGNRQRAKEYYYLCTNADFLEEIGSESLLYDENGEVDASSLFQRLEEFGMDLEDHVTREAAEKALKEGDYDFNEAVYKVVGFNKNSILRRSHMAMLTPTKDGKYHVEVVRRTKKNEDKLAKVIYNQSIQDRIKYYLATNGISIEFLEQGDRRGGRYSSANAEATLDGFYSLIRVAENDYMTESLAEKAGHFAVGAMTGTPMLDRFMKTLTPEVLKAFLGEEYDEYFSEEDKRNVAGIIIGKAIMKGVDRRTPLGRVAYKFIDLVKRLFNVFRFKRGRIANRVLKAKRRAEQIARNMMQETMDEGSINNILYGQDEEFYSDTGELSTSFNIETFKRVLNELKNQAATIASIDKSMYKRFSNIVERVEEGVDVSAPGVFSDSSTIEGITTAITEMLDLLEEEIPSLLQSVDFENEADFYSNMPRNAKSLRTIRTFANTALKLSEIVNLAVSNKSDRKLVGDVRNVDTLNELGLTERRDLVQLAKDLGVFVQNNIMPELLNKESSFFCRFLEDIYGSKYIQRAERVVFKRKHDPSKKEARFLRVEKRPAPIPISDLLNTLEYDITFYEKVLASMSNNSDIIGQIVDKATKSANRWADKLTIQTQDELRALQSRMKAAGIKDTSIFCERSQRDNSITGNFICDIHWGDWENDWLAFKEEKQREFKHKYPNLASMSNIEQGALWNDFFKPLAKEWHFGNAAKGIAPHSVKKTVVEEVIENGQTKRVKKVMYYPSSEGKFDYTNEEYLRMERNNPTMISFLNEFKDLKKKLDDLLPEGSTPHYRLPQFKGSFSNKVRNKHLFEGRARAFAGSVRNAITETFCESSEDTDYGSELTYNSIQEDMFSTQLSQMKENINRVPLYGINKLKDTSQLSTNLFHSMFAYSGMAYTYAASSQIADCLEVGSEVLRKRTVAGREDKGTSRAFVRYTKHLDKQIYGIGVPKYKIGKHLVWNKIVNFLTSFGSRYFLGGNVAGGMVNTGTGTIEVFKEALAGEYYDVKDWLSAHNMYFGFKDSRGLHIPCCVDNLLEWGKDVKENKVSLFLRHFNALQDGKMKTRDWNTRDTRIENFFGNCIWLPYKSGDHYMQAMSYLALANHIKLYDKDGNKIRLYDTYSPGIIEDKDGNLNKNYGKTLKMKDVYFKDKNGSAEYARINNIINQIDDVLNSSSVFGAAIILSEEDKEYLKSQNINIADLKNARTKLNMKAKSLIWNEDDESAFVDKAREINNRLHGIYNSQDKVALQQTLWGNAALAMRGYALGMIERRFGASKFSVALGGETEGSLRTVAKVIMSSATDRGTLLKTLQCVTLPIISPKRTRQMMEGMGFSYNQYCNMRRNFGDIAWILALHLIKILTSKALFGDDDDDDNKAVGLVYYFASRLLREQSAFNTIWGFSEEWPNVTSTLPMGFSAAADFLSMTYKLIGQNFVDPEDTDHPLYSSFYYKTNRNGHEKGDSKGERTFLRRCPYLRTVYSVLEDPYEAAKAFDYGRKVRN